MDKAALEKIRRTAQQKIGITEKVAKAVGKPAAVPIPESDTITLTQLRAKPNEQYWRDREGQAVAVFDYCNAAGEIVVMIVRYEKDGGKSFIQFYSDGKKIRSGISFPDGERPVYGLETLPVDPGITVAIVEGEGVAKDFNNLGIKGFQAFSWMGGSLAVKQTDWTPLKDCKKILIVPDCDQAGLKAGKNIKKELHHAEILKIDGKRKGWDLADGIKEGIDIEKFLNECPRLPEPGEDQDTAQTGAGQIGDEVGCNDVGNSIRLLRACGHIVKYNCIHGYFIVYDGTRYKKDDSGKIYGLAEKMAREIYNEIALEDDVKERIEIAKWANASQNKWRIWAAVDLLKHKVPIYPKDLDRDIYLFNVLNGTIDLRSGKLKKHDPSDLITRIAPVEYDPDAECPEWEKYIAQGFEGNEENIKYVQKCTGYLLSGATSERCMFDGCGPTSTGKTTYANTISELMGDYAISTPTSTLMVKYGGDSIPNDIARLDGPRLVTCDEAEEGQRLNVGLLKQMTGQDKIKARFMRGEWFEFYPQFKIWFSTNHRPVIRDTDKAIWSRIREIPFKVEIPEDKKILDFFKVKLIPELNGILQWALDGYALYQLEGLKSPIDVKNAVEDYRIEMDSLQGFIDGFCILNTREELGKPDELLKLSRYDLEQRGIYNISATYLHNAWIQETGGRLTRSNFGKKLTEKGFVNKHFRDGYYWLGIKINDNTD